MAKSRTVASCVAGQWFQFAAGRPAEAADACTFEPIVDRFVASKGDFKKLVVDLATSNLFRFRAAD
jgi:hypothetical protein